MTAGASAISCIIWFGKILCRSPSTAARGGNAYEPIPGAEKLDDDAWNRLQILETVPCLLFHGAPSAERRVTLRRIAQT